MHSFTKYVKQYVLGFAFSEDREYVTLIRKNRPEWQAGKFNGVGGKVELNEALKDAMIREFREETSVYATAWDQFLVLSGGTKDDNFVVYCYRTFLPQKSFFLSKSVTDEEVGLLRVEQITSDIKFPLIPNLRWIIPMALSMDEDRTSTFFIEEAYGH